jgi:hypothetical protein
MILKFIGKAIIILAVLALEFFFLDYLLTGSPINDYGPVLVLFVFCFANLLAFAILTTVKRDFKRFSKWIDKLNEY